MPPFSVVQWMGPTVATSLLLAATSAGAVASPGDIAATDQQRQAIVGAFATAFLSDDHDGIAANTTPDVTWTIPGSSKISGLMRGRVEIIGLADTLATYELRITLQAITLGVDTVAVELHDTGDHNGMTLDQNVVNVLTIRNDKIAGVAQHLADVGSFDAYFS